MAATGGMIKTDKRLKDLCPMFLANPRTTSRTSIIAVFS